MGVKESSRLIGQNDQRFDFRIYQDQFKILKFIQGIAVWRDRFRQDPAGSCNSLWSLSSEK